MDTLLVNFNLCYQTTDIVFKIRCHFIPSVPENGALRLIVDVENA